MVHVHHMYLLPNLPTYLRVPTFLCPNLPDLPTHSCLYVPTYSVQCTCNSTNNLSSHLPSLPTYLLVPFLHKYYAIIIPTYELNPLCLQFHIFPFRFTFVKEYLIEFNQLAMANASGADDMLNRVMTKDNIGIAALLELKEGYLNYSNDMNMPRQQVLLSNVHIHWDPEFKDVKLIQTVMLMHELMNIMQEINPGFMVQGGEINNAHSNF